MAVRRNGKKAAELAAAALAENEERARTTRLEAAPTMAGAVEGVARALAPYDGPARKRILKAAAALLK